MIVCNECGKEFEPSEVKKFIYNTYEEADIKCDRCIFDDVFSKLEEDFKVIIISNSNKERLTPFKEKLNVDVAFSSRKPFKKKYKKILEIYHFKESEVACVGDQLLTDILGANRMGLTSILVNRMARYEFFPTRINRFIEHFFLKKLARENILVAGEYYD